MIHCQPMYSSSLLPPPLEPNPIAWLCYAVRANAPEQGGSQHHGHDSEQRHTMAQVAGGRFALEIRASSDARLCPVHVQIGLGVYRAAYNSDGPSQQACFRSAGLFRAPALQENEADN
jgi:hypothetical protein